MTVAKSEMLPELTMGEHDFQINRMVHWTISTTVLQWLNLANKNLPDFVTKSCETSKGQQ